MDVIEVKNLMLGFGRKKVLRDVSFSVAKGKVVGYVGRNGTGKTTTIKAIMGLYRPEAGKISLWSDPKGSYKPRIRERIGYVPETQDFYENISVKGALDYISKFYKRWDNEYEKELLSQFRLSPKSHFKDLSRGEKAKLFLTFALAHKPELIIMDEPTSHLDPVARSDFWESTISLISETNASVLVSTHILSDIENIADEFVLLSGGKIVFQTETEELKHSVKKAYITEEYLQKMTDEQRKKIILTKKTAKGYEIYAKNLDLKDCEWESLSVEEILVSYLKGENQ